MKRFLKTPNIPSGKVCLVICDGRVSKKIETSLSKLNIEVIKTSNCSFFDSPVALHPDMQLCHLGDNRFAMWQNIAQHFHSKMVIYGYRDLDIVCSQISDEHLSYPKDIKYNSAILGENVICNSKYTDCNITINKNIINVKQGYAKCSTCIISSNAIITEDASIYKAAEKLGIDVLLIDYGGVSLDGCSYGFIGGASGMIDENKIAFCGNIESHRQFSKIKAFLDKHNVEYVSLSDEPLYDYGSIIPILEEV